MKLDFRIFEVSRKYRTNVDTTSFKYCTAWTLVLEYFHTIIMSFNSYCFSNAEGDIANEKVRCVLDLIHQNFEGDSVIHMGIIYISVGENGGKFVSRHLLFVPFYNPASYGYNFNVPHPFVFVRGFSGYVSSEFYAWIDEVWTIQVFHMDDSSALLTCSPVLLAEFSTVGNATFSLVPWTRSSRGTHTMCALKSQFECWIQGTASPSDMKDLKATSSAAFMDAVNTGDAGAAVTQLKEHLNHHNDFCFPTIQFKVHNPMLGLVPFPLVDLCFKFGGEVPAVAHGEQVVHVPFVQPSADDVRRIGFQRLWSLLYNPDRAELTKGAVAALKSAVRASLGV